MEIEAPDPDAYYRKQVPECLKGKRLAEAFQENLARLEVCCQKGLAERFDASIGAATVLMPFAGKYQLTPEEAMVAKLPVIHGETDDATAMSYGYIPGIARFSPFHGAAYAVVESLSKLCAVGADPLSCRLTFQEYFERLRTDPKRWGKPAAALLGALSAQLGMGLPVDRRQGQHVRFVRADGRAAHAGQLCRRNDEGEQDDFGGVPACGVPRRAAPAAGGRQDHAAELGAFEELL